jgi:hypothetical protein
MDANMKRGSDSAICTFDDFIAHIDNIKTQGDLTQLCYEAYDPYPQMIKKPQSFL